MRRAVAGIVVGIGAAALVLGLDRLDFLQVVELKTYDWRLARTAQPSTARKDLALVEIDEYSLRNLQANAGRWPWPRAVHSLLIDYLARGSARLIAYDVNFAEADTRTGFAFGGSTWSGAESDQALVDSVKKAGNVILLADATYEGEATEQAPALSDAGFRLDSPFVAERKVVFPPFKALADAASGFGHNLFVLDPDGPLRHTVPFVRIGDHALASLGLAAALRAANIRPGSVRVEREAIWIGERRMPISVQRVRSADGEKAYQRSLINFRGPALLEDMKSRPYPSYAFFDLLYAEEQSEQVSASGGARGVGRDRAAKGGPNPTLVKTSVSAADLISFTKGIV